MASSLSRAGFEWCRASLEPVVLMACGKNGATCWLAGAVRTLQKRVEWLEARAQHAAGPAPVWATREVHGGRIIHGAQSLLQWLVWMSLMRRSTLSR